MSHLKWLYVEQIAHDDRQGDSVSEMLNGHEDVREERCCEIRRRVQCHSCARGAKGSKRSRGTFVGILVLGGHQRRELPENRALAQARLGGLRGLLSSQR